MSAAGYLRPSELETVQGTIRLGKITAAWWRRFEAQLRAESGEDPQLTSPDGGYRAAARQLAVNPAVPPDASDHCKGKGIDLYNQRDFRNWNEPRFLAIAAENGFQFYVDGEPWHARCIHTTLPAGSLPGAGSLTTEEDEMRPQIARRVGTAGPEWSLAHPDIAGGYMTTTDPAEAKAWERLYERGYGTSDPLERADYIAWQHAAARVALAMH